MTTPTAPTAYAPAPTTQQLITAFADALLPFAGPYGVAADTVMHAGLAFLSNLQANRASTGLYTMDQIEAAAARATTALATLVADRAAQRNADTAAASGKP